MHDFTITRQTTVLHRPTCVCICLHVFESTGSTTHPVYSSFTRSSEYRVRLSHIMHMTREIVSPAIETDSLIVLGKLKAYETKRRRKEEARNNNSNGSQ
jgi:hypothetical protein